MGRPKLAEIWRYSQSRRGKSRNKVLVGEPACGSFLGTTTHGVAVVVTVDDEQKNSAHTGNLSRVDPRDHLLRRSTPYYTPQRLGFVCVGVL